MKKMKISKAICAILAVGTLSFCFGLSACGSLESSLQDEIETAYLEYMQSVDEDVYGVSAKDYAGTYEDNTVVLATWVSSSAAVSAETVEFFVTDGAETVIYICDLPDSSYDVVVYTEAQEIKELQKAFDDGDITKANLYTIQWSLRW